MILIAVILGYLLGVITFILPKVLEKINNKKTEEEIHENYKSQEEILNEWLNGAKENEQKTTVTQEDIYKEYVTGEVKKGE